jgi:hypothetical protein
MGALGSGHLIRVSPCSYHLCEEKSYLVLLHKTVTVDPLSFKKKSLWGDIGPNEALTYEDGYPSR